MWLSRFLNYTTKYRSVSPALSSTHAGENEWFVWFHRMGTDQRWTVRAVEPQSAQNGIKKTPSPNVIFHQSSPNYICPVWVLISVVVRFDACLATTHDNLTNYVMSLMHSTTHTVTRGLVVTYMCVRSNWRAKTFYLTTSIWIMQVWFPLGILLNIVTDTWERFHNPGHPEFIQSAHKTCEQSLMAIFR